MSVEYLLVVLLRCWFLELAFGLPHFVVLVGDDFPLGSQLFGTKLKERKIERSKHLD